MENNLPSRFASPFHFDMALTAPVFAMSHRGFRVDHEKREEIRATYEDDWARYQGNLDSLFGPTNVQSPKQMTELLYSRLKLPKRLKNGRPTADEDALRSLMAYCKAKLEADARHTERWQAGYLACYLTIKIRGNRKIISSYLAPDIDSDGHVRTMMSIGGTETGRFSHSRTLWGTGLNLATVPRPLRIMYLPTEGMELAEFDLNRGESWVYAHLSMDPELLRIHLENGDFHSETASAISTAFGSRLSVDWIIEHKEGEGYKIRFLGKKFNHASAYRMGPYRATEVVNSEADDTGITITVSQARVGQDLWQAKYSQMPRWWDAIEQQLAVDRTLVTPYNRRRTFYGFWGDHLFKEATAYVPQSTSVDYLNLGMLRVWEELDTPGLLQLLHQNHDSIVVQYPHNRRDEVMGEVISRLQSKLTINGQTFTIPVEGSYGENWRQIKEWRAPAKAA